MRTRYRYTWAIYFQSWDTFLTQTQYFATLGLFRPANTAQTFILHLSFGTERLRRLVSSISLYLCYTFASLHPSTTSFPCLPITSFKTRIKEQERPKTRERLRGRVRILHFNPNGGASSAGRRFGGADPRAWGAGERLNAQGQGAPSTGEKDQFSRREGDTQSGPINLAYSQSWKGTVLALDHDYHIPSDIPEKVTNWSTHDDRHPLTARPVLSSTACSPRSLPLSTPLFGSSGLALYFEYRSFPASGSSSLAQN